MCSFLHDAYAMHCETFRLLKEKDLRDCFPKEAQTSSETSSEASSEVCLWFSFKTVFKRNCNHIYKIHEAYPLRELNPSLRHEKAMS